MSASHIATLPDDLASCLRCRDLVLVRRTPKRGRIALMNPQSYDRGTVDRILALALGRNWQGFQFPGGSYHRSCRAFLWTVPAGEKGGGSWPTA